LKYAVLGVAGAASSTLLAACGQDDASGGDRTVTGRAVKAFAVGTWAVSYPLSSDSADRPFTITVEDGKWKGRGGEAEGMSGTWVFRDGHLKITGWNDHTGIATGVPSHVDPGSGLKRTLQWEYDEDEADPTTLNVPIQWKPKTKTLVLTGTSADGGNIVLEVKRRK
jgi:hypothetical protein